MKIVHFNKMSVRVPLKNDENVDDIENRLIEAVDSIGDGVAMHFSIEIEDEESLFNE